MKIHKTILALLLTLLLTISPVIYAQEDITAQSTDESLTPEQATDYYEQAVHVIMSRYKFDISREELYKATIEHLLKENPDLLENAFDGMFNSLDKYSTYYDEEELNRFITGMSSEICGIGVLITQVDAGLLVTNVYENTPALESGIIIGDIITKVEDISLAGMDVSVAQSYILGDPGTVVNLTISRNGKEFTISPVRRRVTINSGFYQTLENNTIGYIKLTEFTEHAAQFVQGALSIFDAHGITDIIIDLRNNPGGLLSSMVDICSLFIPAGPAIRLEYKNPFKNTILYSENQIPKYNLAVLVNNNSASASEAFSAAIQDTGVGIVIGTTTFGKGTMQNLVNFKIGGGVKITEAEFFSPNGRTINGVGVEPDVRVADKVVPYENAQYEKVTYDRVLNKGDTGKDVLAIEERLDAIGFSVGIPDEIFDEKTYGSVLNFQKATGLYPYGTADITTQLKLEEVLNGNDVTLNNSLEKAIDIFKNDDWTQYKLNWNPTEKSN